MHAAAAKAIGERIGAMWANYCVIYAENQNEQRPEDATWVRWSVRPADTASADVSGIFERTNGLIYFQVFVPVNQGSRPAFAARDKVASIFNEARFPTEDGGVVQSRRAGIRYVAKQEQMWDAWNVTVDYTHDAPAITP